MLVDKCFLRYFSILQLVGSFSYFLSYLKLHCDGGCCDWTQDVRCCLHRRSEVLNISSTNTDLNQGRFYLLTQKFTLSIHDRPAESVIGIQSISVPLTSAGWPTLSYTADPLYVCITQSRFNFTLRSQPLLCTADSTYCILFNWPNLFCRTELSSAPPLIVIFQCHKALVKRNCYLRLTYLNFIFSCSILF